AHPEAAVSPLRNPSCAEWLSCVGRLGQRIQRRSEASWPGCAICAGAADPTYPDACHFSGSSSTGDAAALLPLLRTGVAAACPRRRRGCASNRPSRSMLRYREQDRESAGFLRPFVRAQVHPRIFAEAPAKPALFLAHHARSL